MSRVIVIGAGVGGLATAARLAVKGHDVTVLERSSRVGGKLNTYRRDGFAFDTGPSLLTLPAVYRDVFLKTGAALETVVDLQEVDPGFAYHFADGSRAVVPGVDPAAAATAFGKAFGGTADADWRALIERAGAMWRITREPFLQSPLQGWRSMLALARDPRDISTIAPTKSLRDLGRQYLHDPRLAQILDRYATYTGSDPRQAPAVLATIPYVEQTFGAWHLGGGLGTLADALAQRCRDRGVQIHLDSDVQRIEIAHDAVCGVRISDGSTLPADIVVANADASLVYGSMVDDPRARREARRLAKTTPSLAGFVILLALRGRTEGVQHHNVWFPHRYDDEFDAIFSGRVAQDPAIYACVPDDPLMRPDADTESWFLLVNAPRHGRGERGTTDWTTPGLAEQYADHILDLLAQRGMDLRSRILWRETRTPADLQNATGAPGGSIYGTSSNGSRAAFQRPANQSPIPGLYLVGGSSHPGGGLPLVGMSAEIVAELIGRAQR